MSNPRASLAALAALALFSCARKEGGAKQKDETPAQAPPDVYTDLPMEKCDVLLLGFEPFGGHPFNSSWEVARALDGEKLRGRKVRAVLLPVVWGEASKRLARAINTARPEIAVAFGMGTPTVEIELTAWNERRGGEDNLGNPPPAKVIEEGGPEELHARLPLNELAAALARLGSKFALSTDAGGYLCNEAFYALMREDVSCAGFVHVPVAAPGTDELEELKRAARAMVEACIEAAAR